MDNVKKWLAVQKQMDTLILEYEELKKLREQLFCSIITEILNKEKNEIQETV